MRKKDIKYILYQGLNIIDTNHILYKMNAFASN